MGFFDRNNDEDEKTEEVTLSVPDEKEESGQLKDEAETRLTDDNSSSGSSGQDNSGMLPGMGSGSSGSKNSGKKGSSSSGSSRGKKESVSLEDIHRQNKQIKSILKDIRSEIKDEGDMNGVL